MTFHTAVCWRCDNFYTTTGHSKESENEAQVEVAIYISYLMNGYLLPFSIMTGNLNRPKSDSGAVAGILA